MRADRTSNSGKTMGGGLALYYKDDLRCCEMPEYTICTPDIEMCWVKLMLTNTRPIYMGLVYRPPSGNHISFLYELEHIVTQLRMVGNCEINIYGDVNIDLQMKNNKVRQYNDHLKRLGLYNTIHQVTHIKQQGMGFSQLDHHLTTDPQLYQLTGVIPTNASDHFFIYTVRKKPKAEHEKSRCVGRAYSKLKPEKFVQEINDHDWTEVLNCRDSDMAWTKFQNDFLNILHNHAPLKTFSDREDRQPWVSTEYLESCNERDDLQKIAKNTKQPFDIFLANRARNRTTSLKRELKRLFFQSSIEEANGDSKKLWKALKRLLANSTKKDNINSINNKTEPIEIASEINEYFINIGPNLASEIGQSAIDLDFSNIPNVPFLHLTHTNQNEVEKLMFQISDSKATGNDGIPIRFLKMTSHISSPIIAHIINLTIDTGIIPEGWKEATITPLYKDGDKNSAANYRPISILPAVSKIMERVIHQQVHFHLNQHNLLSEAQFGFRKNHSTCTCILKLLDDIYSNMEMGKLTGVVFLDLKKAFDTVDHNIMINKLNKFNIDEQAREWFRNYLSGRKQSVKYHGTQSAPLLIQCGVPQGSILGPMMFIMYINDLGKYLTDSKVSLYADDTALYTASTTQIELVLNLRVELSVVNEWLKANRLTLNTKKTKYVIFGTRNKLEHAAQDLNITIGGDKLEKVSSMKYLGVILDDLLTFDEHISDIYTKSSQKLGILRRSRDYLDANTSLTLYKSLVLPHLDYCDLVYMNTTVQNLNRLQLIQNGACRTILRVPKDTSVEQMHRELAIPTLNQRRQYHMATECYKAVNNPDSGLHHMFNLLSDTRARNTRLTTNRGMRVPNMKTVQGRKAFKYTGPLCWNSLEPDIKKSETVMSFKSNMLKLIMRDVNHPG